MALEEVVAVDNGRVLGGSSSGSSGGGLTQEEHAWLEALYEGISSRILYFNNMIYGTQQIELDPDKTYYCLTTTGYDNRCIFSTVINNVYTNLFATASTSGLTLSYDDQTHILSIGQNSTGATLVVEVD